MRGGEGERAEGRGGIGQREPASPMHLIRRERGDPYLSVITCLAQREGRRRGG